VGGYEVPTLVGMEPSVKYHPCSVGGSNPDLASQETVAGGQFDWGGRLNCGAL